MSSRDVVSLETKGNFKKTTKWLNNKKNKSLSMDLLHEYGKEGVEELRKATPVRTGKTANSWYYEINKLENGRIELVWCNSNVEKDYANVAILIQYGHATKNGGYVYGIDYINPALKPIFKKIADSINKEIKR